MDNLKELVGSALEMLGHLPADKLEDMGYIKTDPTPTEQSEFDKSYWEKVYTAQVYDLDDNQIKRKVSNNLRSSAMKTGGKQYLPSEAASMLLKLLFSYFKGKAIADINPSKGIILYGGTGIGKTSTMKAFLTVPFYSIEVDKWENEKPVISSSIQFIQSHDDAVDAKGLNPWMDRYLKGDLYLDDIGSEPKHKYASKEDEKLLTKLIEQREIMRSGRLYGTTNVTPSELCEMYGDRAYSRLRGMCNFINCDLLGMKIDYRL
jgi:hypothetical protein